MKSAAVGADEEFVELLVFEPGVPELLVDPAVEFVVELVPELVFEDDPLSELVFVDPVSVLVFVDPSVVLELPPVPPVVFAVVLVPLVAVELVPLLLVWLV